MDKASLQEQARLLQPLVRIGKNGITPGIIEEIKKHVQKKHLVKIKLLRACIEEHDRYDIASQLSAACDAQLIHVVGNTVVLWRK